MGWGLVSIPRLGWGGFRPNPRQNQERRDKSFNPSIGMGWFQTPEIKAAIVEIEKFQSLDWDGVVSDEKIARRFALDI